MVDKIQFPVFVFCGDSYSSYVDNRDLLIRSRKEIHRGFFKDLDIVDSNGVLWCIKEVKQDKYIKIPIMLHLFKWGILGAVKISKAIKRQDLSKSEIVNRIVKSVCFSPPGVSEQFDSDELTSVLMRKKSIRSIIEYFSGDTPDCLKDEFTYIEISNE